MDNPVFARLSRKWAHAGCVGAAWLLAVTLVGCSTQAKRVDCDGTLKPINRAAPQAAAPAPAKEAKSREGKATDEK
jgi:hypothetical protein